MVERVERDGAILCVWIDYGDPVVGYDPGQDVDTDFEAAAIVVAHQDTPCSKPATAWSPLIVEACGHAIAKLPLCSGHAEAMDDKPSHSEHTCIWCGRTSAVACEQPRLLTQDDRDEWVWNVLREPGPRVHAIDELADETAHPLLQDPSEHSMDSGYLDELARQPRGFA